MTSEQFVYWLHGFFELGEAEKLSKKQVQMIKEHLQKVFNKPLNDLRPLSFYGGPFGQSVTLTDKARETIGKYAAKVEGVGDIPDGGTLPASQYDFQPLRGTMNNASDFHGLVHTTHAGSC